MVVITFSSMPDRLVLSIPAIRNLRSMAGVVRLNGGFENNVGNLPEFLNLQELAGRNL